MYLEYVIGGGEMKIDPSNMEAIMECLVATTISEVGSMIREEKYLRKFIASISVVATLLHSITTSGKIFQCEKGQHKYF